MMDDEVREVGDDEIADELTAETEFGTIWTLLWLVVNAERQATALALVGDRSNGAAGAESLRRWAEPQLAEFRYNGPVPTIPWRRVAKILRDHLPYNTG